MREPLLRPPVYPFKRYEKVLASVLAAGIVTGTGLGIRQGLTPPTQPEPETRICFNFGLVVGWHLWCWEPKKLEPPPDPQPCPPPTPACDPSSQSCP